MSHIATIKTALKDIAAIKAAGAEFGMVFNENKTVCHYYSNQTVPSTHTFTVNGTKMEVGLVLQPDGTYTVVADDMLLYEGNQPYNRTRFGCATNPLANSMGGFMQRYAVCKTEIEARKKGWMCKRVAQGAKMQVHVTGM